jgi:nitroreductase
MDLQSLETLIKGRRSIRKWKKTEVPSDLIKKAVELGTWAPNGGNYQGWQFTAVKNQKVIEKMADAVQSIADKVASWPEAKTWQDEVDRYRKHTSFFRNAPCVIAVFISQYQSVADKVLLARGPADKEATEILASRRSAPTAVESASAAITTLLLAFHQMGLGAVWLASPLQAKKEIEAILNVPASFDLVSLVAVGYPEEAPQKDRKPVDQVLKFID